MSHLKEREAKNCLNCNAQVQGKYCHICGQENLEPKETAWHLITHFFQDITHFDGKFFHMLKLMIAKPGFVSAEYMRGRRASYLNPVRMYIFTSAVFFLLFFSIIPLDRMKEGEAPAINGKSLAEIAKMDSLTFNNFSASVNKGRPMNRLQMEKMIDSIRKESGIEINLTASRTKKEYDSALAKGTTKDSWLARRINYKVFEINEKYRNNKAGLLSTFLESLVHKFPQMLFISLPLFALLLKLLYFRRKQFYYVSHGIFSLHLYIFVFFSLLFLFLLNSINDHLNWGFITFMIWVLGLGIFFYQYKAMRNFYGQGREKTILKFFLLNTLSFLMITMLMAVFMFFSFMKI